MIDEGYSFDGIEEQSKFGKFTKTEDISDDLDEDIPSFHSMRELFNEATITPTKTERESDLLKKSNVPTPNQMDAYLEELHRAAKIPP